MYCQGQGEFFGDWQSSASSDSDLYGFYGSWALMTIWADNEKRLDCSHEIKKKPLAPFLVTTRDDPSAVEESLHSR